MCEEQLYQGCSSSEASSNCSSWLASKQQLQMSYCTSREICHWIKAVECVQFTNIACGYVAKDFSRILQIAVCTIAAWPCACAAGIYFSEPMSRNVDGAIFLIEHWTMMNRIPEANPPTQFDVILGRGKGNQRHPGNIRFQGTSFCRALFSV
jgi:hypothetical protein